MPDRDANDSTLLCYRCGASLAVLTPPLSRRDLCPACGVELHVCRMCQHYAPGKPDDCSEEDAIAVRDKAVANFCDFFAPSADVFDGREQQAGRAAKGQLAALFGDAETAPPNADEALTEAEKLFRK